MSHSTTTNFQRFNKPIGQNLMGLGIPHTINQRYLIKTDLNLVLLWKGKKQHPIASQINAIYFQFSYDILNPYFSKISLLHELFGIVMLHALFGIVMLHDIIGIVMLHELFGIVMLHELFGIVMLHELIGIVMLHELFGIVMLHELFGIVMLHESIH